MFAHDESTAEHVIRVTARYSFDLLVDEEGRDWITEQFPIWYPNVEAREYPEFRSPLMHETVYRVRFSLQAKDAMIVATMFGISIDLNLQGSEDALRAIREMDAGAGSTGASESPD